MFFPPFRGGGIPGLNMSEPGNKSIKPANTMRLVTAAIYDVSHNGLSGATIAFVQPQFIKMCREEGLNKRSL